MSPPKRLLEAISFAILIGVAPAQANEIVTATKFARQHFPNDPKNQDTYIRLWVAWRTCERRPIASIGVCLKLRYCLSYTKP